jgi:subtilase family serine protease
LRYFAALLAAAGCLVALGAVGAEPKTELPQTRASWASAENDLGATDPGLRLTNLTLVLNRSAERQNAFETLLAEQHDPASPNFHRWLTPTQIGEQFGAADADIAAVSSWLKSQGLSVDSVASSRVRIEFSGTAANVGAAFGAPLHTYLVDGEAMISPASTPKIPSSLARILQSVHGMQTIRERPQSHSMVMEARMAAPGEQPKATLCNGSVCNHFVGPADFAAIYDVDSVYQQGVNGSGQTIAIVGRSRVYATDIENFQAFMGLATKDPVTIIPPNGVDPGPAATTSDSADHTDQLEATLDVTRAGSVAPGATIDLVVSANAAGTDGVIIAIQHVVDTNLAQVMSISFSACEQSTGQAATSLLDGIFSQAAAQGMSIFVGSGDSGVAGCDKNFTAPPSSQSVSTNAICSSGYVTCVGGTQFADTANPNAYWSPSNLPGRESALGYIPEGAWNEPLDSSGKPQIAATGGGVSAFIPTPSWQVGPGVPGTQGRYTPDVSFTSSAHNAYLNCMTAGGGPCVPDSSGIIHFEISYGTSAAAPSMAGISALLNQKMAGAQGNLNPRLYSLASSSGNGVFHDVTVATSGSAGCDPSVPSTCNSSTPGPTTLTGGLAGYAVGPGYDMVTGLGSIDVAKLLANWSSASSTGANAPGPVSGLWYNPSESGWGIGFTQRRNIVFATWFTYDGSGNPKWYVASSCAMPAGTTGASGTCAGSLYEVSGPTFFGTGFDPTRVSVATVGSLTVTFQDANTASMSYTLNGQSRTVAIVRQVFQVGTTLPAVNYTDLWWNPSESGWGMLISHEYGVMFLAWFVYDSNGRPVWYVASDCVVAASGCTGSLYRVTGPPFGPSFDATQVHATATGTSTLTFSDPNNGVLTFTVNGVSGSKSITRQLF